MTALPFRIFALFLTILVGAVAGCRTDEASVLADAAPGATGNWSAEAKAGIAAGEYAPQVDGERFRVTNRAQNLRGSFGERGVTIQRRDGTGEVGLRLTAWGREGATEQAAPAFPEEGPCLVGGGVDAFGECLHRVDYARPGLTEWWENRSEGLELGYSVTAPPDGDGALVFELALSGALADVDGDEALLVREVGEPLRLAKLAAWDERGRELPAWMEETEDGLRLVVDDEGAIGVVTVDPLMTTASWTAEGDQATAYFGGSVASAGDVNGDGFGDVVIGAYYYDNGETNEGRAYVFLGAASGLSTSAAWTAEGDQASAYFGTSVAGAGDVNGDGYGDVIVGASGYDNGEGDEGRAYLYFGSSSGLATASSWTAESDQNDAAFGYSVASAGDTNGDGYGDVVVGARSYNNGETDEGRAYVYLGSSAGLATSAGWTAESDSAGANFGGSVGSAGDVDGDGYGDLVVGASGYDGSAENAGQAYLYLGSGAGLAASAAWTAGSTEIFANFGQSVASAGDVNGDGYGDVVVGGHNLSDGSSHEGQAYLYLGSAAGLSASSAWTAGSDQVEAYFGYSVASAGDINGDGYGDVVVGACAYDNGSGDEGRAYVYLGSSTGLASSAAWTQESDQTSAYFGGSVAAAGDVNGDGYGDVLVGAAAYDNGETDEGRVSVFLGSGSGLGTGEAWSAEGGQASALLGISVASAGDVDGDGYGDVVVGASGFENGEAYEGRAYVYLGSSAGLATSAAWTAESDQASAAFGSSVSSAGDVNGDGYGDVAVGARGYSNGQASEGRAYLYLGSAAGLATSAGWTAESEQASADFGTSVASAGDVDGDGYGDMVVGAHKFDNGQIDEGRAYLYLGSAAGLATAAAWTAESDQASAYFGLAVSSAADVNGDGYGDLVVGAIGYSNGESSEGRAYVYLGSASGLATSASWTVESDQANAYFGYSVSSAGDANGDGYGDLVVGAYTYDDGETNEGAAFVYLGSATGPATSAVWTAASDQASAYLGFSVSSAGDVNGDGYGDVVVGAQGWENGESDEGRTYLYLGSPTGPGTSAAWTAESNQSDALYGSVASAGDVNGDGYADVIAAARYYTNGSTREGAAFVYYGNADDGTTPLSLASQARQTGTTTPIAPGLASTSETTFDVAMLSARTSFGLGEVKLQVEAKPLGTAFDGTDLTTSASFVSSGLTGVEIQEELAGLTGDTGYHWRARVLASPAEGRPQGTGRWVYGGLSGNAQGAHVYTLRGSPFYADTDGDGYGDPASSITSSASSVAGYVTDETDCDDTSATVNPGASETVADGIDQDCDDVDDCYTDDDGDSFGTAVVTDGSSLDCVTGTGASASTDCDDTSASIYPGATELTADSVDQDCDSVDSCYTDADGDNYGTTVVTDGSSLSCVTGTGAAVSTDCDDASSSTNPAAAEAAADGIDQNCNSVDSCYTDADGDNYGTGVVTDGSSLDCVTGTGAAASTDCDDTSATIYPSATETTADSIDQDCDSVDACYTDTDGDDYGTSVVIDGSSLSCATGTGAAVSTDCDDASASINPGATETIGDGTDQDCTGTEDCYTDADGDGYRAETALTSADTDCSDAGEALSTLPAGDCDDSSAAFNPAALEPDCADPTDYNCDGSAGSADMDGDGFAACEECDDTDDAVNPDATELPGDSVDQDCDDTELCYADADDDGYRPDDGSTVASPDLACDGVGEAAETDPAGDCDDTVAAIFPGSTELPGDEIDQDCDGTELCYVDGDADGYTADGPTTIASDDGLCDASGEASSTTPAGDCDDANAAYNPGATESDCEDPNDYNCDGATGTTDGDLDGFPACEECDDTNAAVNPAAYELCNDLDDNCDGLIDTDAVDAPTWYADADRDGYADLDDSVTACDPPAGYIAATEADCDDFDAPSHPGGDDLPGDGLDQDCDGADARDGNADDTGEAEKDGCGCSSGGGSFAWSLVCVVAAMALRRKPSTVPTEKP